MSQNHLPELASDIVRRALDAGATGAECTITEGDEFSANVRMRELENLKEAGSRAAGLRIMIGARTGASYTSDLSREGVERLVHSAIELADITTEDPHAGLPEPEDLGAIGGDLRLYSPDVEQLDVVIAPALAVDPTCQRIGYGAGYYDRTLPRYAPPAITIGVAYDWQVVAEIPVTQGDVALDFVVTDVRQFQR